MLLLTLAAVFHGALAILHVQRNEIREFDLLDGLWTFVREPINSEVGLPRSWQTQDLAKFANHTVMPVPSAYNDLTADAELRDHVGWVWYQKKELVPSSTAGKTLMLRFGSVNYYCNVYLNGKLLGNHVGGHLPFQFDVSSKIHPGQTNTITVAVNNSLSWATIPQGDFNYMPTSARNVSGRMLSRTPPGAFKDIGNFDFFNYAGIMRSVHLLKLPATHIDEINIVAEHLGSFTYTVEINANATDEELHVSISDPDGKEVWTGKGPAGKGKVSNVRPWWPRGMGDPDLYTLTAAVVKKTGGQVVDIYRQTFGFRSVSWTDRQILINDKPFYCLGFGMHEDFEIHGRGFNPAVMTKDLNLLEWMGGNCYRTTHYPYAEERMYENDRRGIVVVAETPAVGLKGYPKNNQLLHIQMLQDLIFRDRNHPSIIMWSLANEPHTEKKESRQYFKFLVDFAHSVDPTRPVTIVYGPTNFDSDQTADLIDIICVNRYYGWYWDMGYLDWVNHSIYWDISLWHDTFKRPILLTEYGADSLPGLNQEPSVDFSEQYQNDLIRRTHEGLDKLRAEHLLAGEMIWNFADFMTGMTTTRAVGNHKGIFTRTRQAKQAAYTLRRRYLGLFDQKKSDLW